MRLLRILQAFQRARVRLARDPETRRKLAVTLRALGDASSLPEPIDVACVMPPSLPTYVRRAPGLALWVWFTFDDWTVTLRALTDHPPP